MKIKIFVYILILLFTSCRNNFVPKPRGFFRIDLPVHSYGPYISDFPYSFDYSEYANISVVNKDSFWINIEYNELLGKIHLSYKAINNNFSKYLEDSHMLAYKHSTKADAINETRYENYEKKVYGILYEIKGNVASSVQFFLSDSIRNFIRGALYFEVLPNKDSLAPVIKYIKDDIVYLMESFSWK